ncbi:hypothetical protein HAX54_024439 [Datura stramonium]|uniref:DUF4283 domain-containing protein n=1 Tax=Datura stramonium TaxID=4076 RepID=A0ABS8S5E4_DATST|nr:hypothetical protein [Datura stramonium]
MVRSLLFATNWKSLGIEEEGPIWYGWIERKRGFMTSIHICHNILLWIGHITCLASEGIGEIRIVAVQGRRKRQIIVLELKENYGWTDIAGKIQWFVEKRNNKPFGKLTTNLQARSKYDLDIDYEELDLVVELGVVEMVGKKILLEFPSNYEAARAVVHVSRWRGFKVNLCDRTSSNAFSVKNNIANHIWIRLNNFPAYMWRGDTSKDIGNHYRGFVSLYEGARTRVHLNGREFKFDPHQPKLQSTFFFKTWSAELKFWWVQRKRMIVMENLLLTAMVIARGLVEELILKRPCANGVI